MLNIFKLNSINYETEYRIQIAFCDKTQDFRNLNILGVLTRPYQAQGPRLPTTAGSPSVRGTARQSVNCTVLI